MVKLSNPYKRFLTIFSLVFCSGLTQAEWVLSNEDSIINFVSVKNASTAEVHSFKKLSGQINNKGQVQINIDLASVDTLIKIRDERMREFLLETNLYPKSTITATINTNPIKQLTPGASLTMPISFELDLHGKKKTIKSSVKVVALHNKRVYVSTVSPLTLNLADHDFIKGINKLRDIAKLSSISTSVAITAQLEFSR